MRGDFTVLRFQPAKHYSGVRQQQGRVQTDADWNEQADVEAHRDRTTALDVVGPAGAPIDHAGFGLTCSGGDIEGAGCPAGSVRIGAGRYYVDGILCENEAEVPVNAQPDLPGVAFSGTAGSRYLAYLDVWEQHITVLEDESIREVALGGPDTATRLRTVWQVRLEGPVSSPCSAFATGWAPAGAATDGTMAARAQEAEQVTSDCLVPAGAGYRRLENQLYRVEVHDGGAALAFPRPAAVVADAVTVPDASHVKVTNWVVGGVPWHTGQVVEVFSPATDAASTVGTLALVTAADQPSKTLTLDASLAGLQGASGVKLRRVATFTWSRENGSVVASLDAIDPLTSALTVSHPNREMLSGFAPGQWVELSDRGRVLRGEPGMLVELAKVQGDKLTVVAWPGGTAPSLATDFGEQPTVRRWESKGATAVVAGGLLDLEGGVQVQFGAGTFRTGDYWTIPARSLTHTVDWPLVPDPADPSKPALPALLPPEGIDHHYAPLALLDLQANGTTWKLASDCRNLFPPLTGLLSFTYLGGDGQETAPDLTGAAPAMPSALPEPLRVRVSNGRYPVKGAPVRFAVDANLGSVNGAKTVPVATDDHGVASCSWTLDPDPAHAVQHVAATLLDDTGQPMAGVPPIRFTANLSFAAEVAFDPRGEQCAVLDHAVTVQDAIDTLSMLTSLTYAGGDGQEARPGQGLPQLLRVLAGNGCGGVQGAKVQFLASGNGRVAATVADLANSTSASLDATTGADGIAACAWLPDPGGPSSQQLTATLDDSAGNPTTVPTAVVFTANLSVAAEVAYTPTPNCQLLAGTETVQEAIDVLCTQGGGKDPGIHVRAVVLLAGNAPLRNDSVIPPNALSEGIRFILDADVDPVVKGKPVVTLTLDLPFPVSDADRQTWGVPAPPAPGFTVGTMPLTLRALVEAGGQSLLWRLDPQIAPWFLNTLFKVLIDRGVTDPVLAHLVAKGNFIWAAGNELLNLDGEVFGTPGPGTIDVKLPSGDGRRGGDLEMWFRIRGG